jgi:hypothetical protein
MSRRRPLLLPMQECPRNTVRETLSWHTLPILILALQGDILCLRVFGQVFVVLCSYPAIKDLLDKRGDTYADRPTLPIVELCVLRGVYPSC